MAEPGRDLVEDARQKLVRDARLMRRVADGDRRARLDLVKISYEYTCLCVRYLNTLERLTRSERWLGQGVKEHAAPIIAEVRAYVAKQKSKKAIVANSPYIRILLNANRALGYLRDGTAQRGIESKDRLTTRKAKARLKDPREISPLYDLWVHGYNFNADADKGEHRVSIVDVQGREKHIGDVAFAGDDGGGKTRCYVFHGLSWKDVPRKALTVRIYDKPNDPWPASRIFALFVMPPDAKVDNDRATWLLRNKLDLVRRKSAGFVEYGYAGLINRDGQTAETSIKIVGRDAGDLAW